MDGGRAARTSLLREPALQALLAVTVLGFASYCLTLASLPTYAVEGGADASTAGVVTAVFLGVTIAAQIAVPALTARFGTGPVLALGLLAMGLPSPLYALDDGLLWLSVLSAVRGVGFGIITVLGALLAAAVAPAERRGEAIGLYGLAVAVPNLIGVPAGVALVLDGHAAWMAWLSASPLLGLLFLPALMRAAAPLVPSPGGGAGRRAVGAALAPSAVLLAVTLAGGGVVTFLPIERPDGALATVALVVMGVGAALARWRVGVLADRLGTRLLLPAGVAVGAVGMALLGAGLRWDDAALLVGVALFGISYGAVQNLTLLTAFARAGAGGATAASAMWNASFDAGTAMGALALGWVAGGLGLPWTYAWVAVLLAVTTPLAVAATRPVAAVARPPEA
ncbi:MFS transporter [Trujillonella endophytica]|uniref:Predicted arabinose efflux permease, MFS family n=1 Tax=Trujillonella endophytica TaxID=673521 RepID=A0A1H8UPF1_9ACTN|nr:MFS transporter [Trujillella endophytica]SEP04478.1 Predicted arabinose efflux permease, MFS family [Trujillella endophytica]